MPGLELEFFAAQLDFHALAVVAVNDRRPRPARQLDLPGQRPALQVLVALQIEEWILAMLAIEFFRDVIDDHVVPILAAEPMITVRRNHLDALAFDPHDGHVERAAAEVEHKNSLVFVELVEAIRDRCRCRLVDDLKNVKSGKLPRGYRCGPLCVVEVSRHRDHRVGYRFLEIFFRVGFQFPQDQRRQFFGRINFPTKFPLELFLRFAHFAFHEIHDPFRFRDRVVLCQGADDDGRAVKQDHRGREPLAFGVGDNLRLAVRIDVRHRAERRSEVNANYFSLRRRCSHLAIRRMCGSKHQA